MPISGVTDGRDWIEIYSGKRGMGGSASRTIVDRSTTDLGGGRGGGSGRTPAGLAGAGGSCPWISLDSK